MHPTLSSYDNDESKSQRGFKQGVTTVQEKDYVTLISGASAIESTERHFDKEKEESTLNHNEVTEILQDGHFDAQPRTEFRTYFSTNRNKGKPGKGEQPA